MMYKTSAIYQWALRQSAQKPMSTRALRKALHAHLAADKDCDALTDAVIQRLQKLNIINDTRLAQTLALQYQDHGDRFIRQQLKQAELDEISIAAAISSLPAEEFRAFEVVNSFRSTRPTQSPMTHTILPSLLQRGFDATLCQKVIENITKHTVK